MNKHTIRLRGRGQWYLYVKKIVVAYLLLTFWTQKVNNFIVLFGVRVLKKHRTLCTLSKNVDNCEQLLIPWPGMQYDNHYLFILWHIIWNTYYLGPSKMKEAWDWNLRIAIWGLSLNGICRLQDQKHNTGVLWTMCKHGMQEPKRNDPRLCQTPTVCYYLEFGLFKQNKLYPWYDAALTLWQRTFITHCNT